MPTGYIVWLSWNTVYIVGVVLCWDPPQITTYSVTFLWSECKCVNDSQLSCPAGRCDILLMCKKSQWSVSDTRGWLQCRAHTMFIITFTQPDSCYTCAEYPKHLSDVKHCMKFTCTCIKLNSSNDSNMQNVSVSGLSAEYERAKGIHEAQNWALNCP